jgi:uncharacterized protein with NRDE domain
MCLILFALQQHPSHRLIVAANRDEYYDRPSAPPAFWPEAPHLLAGKDLKSGGTWLGITKKGRIAAVTNYRDPASTRKNAVSRGWLVKDFLLGNDGTEEFLIKVRQEGRKYNGFNLVVGVRDELYWYSNRTGEIVKLSQGLHGISNRLLDTPWPKVIRAKRGMSEILGKNVEISPETFFDLLQDRTQAPEEILPDTGVGIEWERILSPVFTVSPTYGTRSSTLVFFDNNDQVTFIDRTFNAHPQPVSSRFTFTLES